MRIKRFSARDLPQVVAQIKEEFGLQAIILSQRALSDGQVEVTAGVRDEDLPPGAPPFEESGAENPPPPGISPSYDEAESGAPPIIEGDDPFARALREEAEKPEISAAELAAAAPQVKAKPMGPVRRADPGSTGVRAGALGPVGPAPAGRAAYGESAPPSASAQILESDQALKASKAQNAIEGSGPGQRAASPAAAAAYQAGGPPPAKPKAFGAPASGASRSPLSGAAGAGSQASAPPVSGAPALGAPGARPKASPAPSAPARLMPRASGSASPKPAPLTAPAMGVAAYRKVQSGSAGSDVGREVVLLREQVGERFEELKTLLMDLAHRQSLSDRWRERQDLVGLYRRLLGTGLSPDKSREFVEKAAESQEAWGGDLIEHLRRTARPAIRCLSPETPLPRLVAMAGPSGSGKTTTLVRLAAFCQRRGQKVSAITLDTLKLGAAEQLSQYARIMGLGLKACQTKSEFDEALEIFEGSDVIVVDTNSRDLGPAPKTGEAYRALMAAGAKFLLALPASLKTDDLTRLYQRLSGPDLLGLVLTKIDESFSLGNVVTFLSSSAAPLAFISAGPRTPEDFQAAKADRLIDYWLKDGDQIP